MKKSRGGIKEHRVNVSRNNLLGHKLAQDKAKRSRLATHTR